jgi:8-oxo-dGTP pyrophosphatase MutT (NUDIX family)
MKGNDGRLIDSTIEPPSGQLTADLRRASRRFDAAAHVRLLCNGVEIGWLRKSHARRLMDWPHVFKRDARGVRIAESLDQPAARTAAIDEVVDALHRDGAIAGWRNERYAVVSAFDAAPLFHIERAAARFFGTTTYAAHANGYCPTGSGCDMWLARRAVTKPIDPGMLDNLVGGGMCAGVPPLDTIVREAWEEAGVPQELARNATPAGTIDIVREVPEGVQSEVIFVFELELPHTFEPHNKDGEVADFQRLPLGKLVSMLGRGLITLDASLVITRFIERLK